MKTKSNLPTKGARKIQTGFVGFFDILGYGTFLESGITDVAFQVVDILAGLQKIIHKDVKGHIGEVPDIQREFEQVRILVISDSILLSLAYNKKSSQSEKAARAHTFLITAQILQRVMFESGLPLRGAIAFGNFIFVEHVFAGKPIINAHTLGHSLNLAACAIHETAEREFKRLLTDVPQTNNLFASDWHIVRYSTPIKNVDKELELPLLNFAWPTLKGYIPLKDRHDLRQYIHEQFLAHNKQLKQDGIQKLENTERFFRFLRGRCPKLFERDP